MSFMKLIAFHECGKIVNTHGVMGAVKIESWCNTPAVLAKLKRVYLPTKEGMKELKVNRASVFKQFVIAELEGMKTVSDEEFKAELQYWVDYYNGYMTEEELLANMGEDVIRSGALSEKIQKWLLEQAAFTFADAE